MNFLTEHKQLFKPTEDPIGLLDALPSWTRELVLNPPKAGGGFHNWLFKAARYLLMYKKSPSEVFEYLQQASLLCGRSVPQREINDAIQAASVSLSITPPRKNGFLSFPAKRTSGAWPKRNDLRIQTLIEEDYSLKSLLETSDDLSVYSNHGNITFAYLIMLYCPTSYLCMGTTLQKCSTMTFQQWGNLNREMQFIVPNPMIRPFGLTQNGTISSRCLDNVGKRRFMVIEFDGMPRDVQGSILHYLSFRAPLCMIVDSGNKSIHGWFFCEGQPEPLLRSFMEEAVILGADKATWTLCQMVRIPFGLRADTQRRQEVLFFKRALVTPEFQDDVLNKQDGEYE